MLYFYFLLQIPLKMLCYRARGGAIPLGSTTLARILFWGFPYAIDAVIFDCLLGGNLPAHVLMFFCALLVGSVAATIEHSPWQSPSGYNYFVMGLITTGMLTSMLCPFFFIAPVMLAFLPLGMLGAVASFFGYSKPVQEYGFSWCGVQWCVPGDSSWEELFIGALPFGVAICAIGFYLLNHS